MKPALLTIRSIGAEYANRIYIVVAVLFFLSAVVSLGLGIWLTTFSNWWWLLVVVLILAISVATGVLIIIKLVIRTVRPHQTRSQKIQITAFVDKLERLSETAQTPKFILLFRIVRDIAAPRENGFIANISSDSTSLRHDFVELTRTFK